MTDAQAQNADVLQKLSDDQRAAARQTTQTQEVRADAPEPEPAQPSAPVIQPESATESATESAKAAPRPSTKRGAATGT